MTVKFLSSVFMNIMHILCSFYVCFDTFGVLNNFYMSIVQLCKHRFGTLYRTLIIYEFFERFVFMYFLPFIYFYLFLRTFTRFFDKFECKNPIGKIRPGFALQFISLFCQDLNRLLQLIVLLLRYHHFIGYSRIQFCFHIRRNADAVNVVAVWCVVFGNGQLHGGAVA